MTAVPQQHQAEAEAEAAGRFGLPQSMPVIAIDIEIVRPIAYWNISAVNPTMIDDKLLYDDDQCIATPHGPRRRGCWNDLCMYETNNSTQQRSIAEQQSTRYYL